ncbi:MAG TPA: Gfo/Idh/MocA family oxidoreductase [Armatimonadetes bacterium]|nr:Gfo/Idh/MocA family oxidoreductase [Armatimonadota bacterium]
MSSTDAESPIRIGIIGCGGNMQGHVKRLLATGEVDLVAFCDVREDAAIKTAENAGVEAVIGRTIFNDYETMLETVEMDAVCISTPHTLHFEQIMASLERGLHVLVEKPMVCKVDHAKRIIEVARNVNKIVLVSYQRRYHPKYRYLRDAVLKGRIGRVIFVQAWLVQNWIRGQMARRAWRVQPQLSGGGQLMDSGSHLVDCIMWCANLTPQEVFAYIDNYNSPVDVLNAISVKFNEGALGTISVLGEAPRFREELVIWGDKGAIYSLPEGILEDMFDGDSRMVPQEELPPASNPDRNFVDAVRGRDVVQSPPECGLRVVQLTEAAYKSAQTRQPIAVSDL